MELVTSFWLGEGTFGETEVFSNDRGMCAMTTKRCLNLNNFAIAQLSRNIFFPFL